MDADIETRVREAVRSWWALRFEDRYTYRVANEATWQVLELLEQLEGAGVILDEDRAVSRYGVMSVVKRAERIDAREVVPPAPISPESPGARAAAHQWYRAHEKWNVFLRALKGHTSATGTIEDRTIGNALRGIFPDLDDLISFEVDRTFWTGARIALENRGSYVSDAIAHLCVIARKIEPYVTASVFGDLYSDASRS